MGNKNSRATMLRYGKYGNVGQTTREKKIVCESHGARFVIFVTCFMINLKKISSAHVSESFREDFSHIFD